MKKNRFDIILALILAISLFLRLFKIGSLPAGLHRDEVSTGYNAYTLLLTGRDEHQQFLPLVFKAFGDWKRPLNIYLTAAFIPIFGLNAYAVRLPIALLGALSPLLLYLIVLKLFRKRNLALLSALIMALSPWHIYMSRTGLGWNVVGLFLLLVAIWSFLVALEKPRLYVLSGLTFGLSFFSYASNQIFALLLTVFGGPALLYHFWKKSQNKVVRRWGLFGLAVVLFCASLFLYVYLPVFKVNAAGSTFFSDDFIYNHAVIFQSAHNSFFFGKFFHNKLFVWLAGFVQNFLEVLSPQFFLFNTADNPAYSLAGFGNVNWPILPAAIIGIFYLARQRRRLLAVFLGYGVLAIVPTALTKSPLSSTRLLMLVPLLAILAAYGLTTFFANYRRHRFFAVLLVLIVSLYVVSLTRFLDEYFVHFSVNRAEHWGVAQKQLVAVLENSPGAEEVVISRPEESFYAYLLFYRRYNPQQFWQEVSWYPETADGFSHVKKFDRYSFRNLDYPEDLRVPGRLLVDKTVHMGNWAQGGYEFFAGLDSLGRKVYIHTRVKAQINLPDGLPVYTVLETYEEKVN